MNLLCLLDAACLSVLLLCAVDIIRQTNPLRHPFHAIGFVAMALGAAAWILQDARGIEPAWFSIVFHAGLAIYSALGAYALWANKKGLKRAATIDEPVSFFSQTVTDYLATPARRKEDRARLH